MGLVCQQCAKDGTHWSDNCPHVADIWREGYDRALRHDSHLPMSLTQRVTFRRHCRIFIISRPTPSIASSTKKKPGSRLCRSLPATACPRLHCEAIPGANARLKNSQLLAGRRCLSLPAATRHIGNGARTLRLGWIPALPHREFSLRLQKDPEREHMRDQQ